MLIDWFTVIAQIVNFLILVYLLKRFLYGRIIQAMDSREKQIASRFQEAEKEKKTMEQEKECYQQKNKEIEKKREEIITHASKEAEELKKEMVEKAKEETGALREKWHQSLDEEKGSFLHEVREKTKRQICSITSKALSDLANFELEQCIINVFLKKVEEMDAQELDKLKQTFHSSREKVEIWTAFDIPENKRSDISRRIHNIIEQDIVIEYKKSAELIGGIQMKIKDYSVEWNLNDYIVSLEEEIEKLFEEETKG